MKIRSREIQQTGNKNKLDWCQSVSENCKQRQGVGADTHSFYLHTPSTYLPTFYLDTYSFYDTHLVPINSYFLASLFLAAYPLHIILLPP